MEVVEVQLFWGYVVGLWWDLVVGVRQDFRFVFVWIWVVVGFQGLVFYNFEFEIMGFVSNGGKVVFCLGGEYDVLLINWFIFQLFYEVNFYSQDDELWGCGRGLIDIELGFWLCYEICCEFVFYIGVFWN